MIVQAASAVLDAYAAEPHGELYDSLEREFIRLLNEIRFQSDWGDPIQLARIIVLVDGLKQHSDPGGCK